MAYYTSTTCGYVNNSWVYDGCTTSYNSSEVKYVVDAWAQAKFTDQLKTVDGYSARLINYDELQVEKRQICQGYCYDADFVKYDWMYGPYSYWTMSSEDDYLYTIYDVENNGLLGSDRIYSVNHSNYVRPVINVYKTAIQS